MKVLKTLLDGIKNTLSPPHPKNRVLYAVTGGTYLGEFFIYMEKQDNVYYFLSLPKMIVREIPHDNFDYAIDNKILDPVETITREVHTLCTAQYKKSAKKDK